MGSAETGGPGGELTSKAENFLMPWARLYALIAWSKPFVATREPNPAVDWTAELVGWNRSTAAVRLGLGPCCGYLSAPDTHLSPSQTQFDPTVPEQHVGTYLLHRTL